MTTPGAPTAKNRELVTSSDGQWIVTRAGRVATLLVPRTAAQAAPVVADGDVAQPRLAAGVVGTFELPSADAEIVAVHGPPALFVAITRSADATRVALYVPPELEPATELELGARAHVETVSGGRIALVTEDRHEMTLVRAAGRALAAHPVDLGEGPVELAVGIERNQLVIAQPRKLDVWDAVSGRPLRRLALELPPPPRIAGAAAGHLWIARGTDELVIFRLSDGRPFRHLVGERIEQVVAHPLSPLLVLVTQSAIARLHCYAHSLFVVDAPWRAGEPLAQLVAGDDISLVGWSAGTSEPWSVAIGGGGAPGVADPVPQESAGTVNAAEKFRQMREAQSVTRASGVQLMMGGGEPTTFAAKPPGAAAASPAPAPFSPATASSAAATPFSPTATAPQLSRTPAAPSSSSGASAPPSAAAAAAPAAPSFAATFPQSPPFNPAPAPAPSFAATFGSSATAAAAPPAALAPPPFPPSNPFAAPPPPPQSAPIANPFAPPPPQSAPAANPFPPSSPIATLPPPLPAPGRSGAVAVAVHDDAPPPLGAGDGSWRDALALFAHDLLRGVDGELPQLGAETTLHVLGRRLGLSTQASRALGVLYALHLVGAPAIALGRLAHQLGDWAEALGTGQLGALAMLDRDRGTVALAAPVTDVLDGAAPRDVRLVGGPPTTPRAGAWRMSRDRRTDAEIEEMLARDLEHIAVVEGRLAPALLEARLHGATAVSLVPPADQRPRPWPQGAGLVLVLYGTVSAWVADVPPY